MAAASLGVGTVAAVAAAVDAVAAIVEGAVVWVASAGIGWVVAIGALAAFFAVVGTVVGGRHRKAMPQWPEGKTPTLWACRHRMMVRQQAAEMPFGKRSDWV